MKSKIGFTKDGQRIRVWTSRFAQEKPVPVVLSFGEYPNGQTLLALDRVVDGLSCKNPDTMPFMTMTLNRPGWVLGQGYAVLRDFKRMVEWLTEERIIEQEPVAVIKGLDMSMVISKLLVTADEFEKGDCVKRDGNRL
jgi:hypothetical protein